MTHEEEQEMGFKEPEAPPETAWQVAKRLLRPRREGMGRRAWQALIVGGAILAGLWHWLGS